MRRRDILRFVPALAAWQAPRKTLAAGASLDNMARLRTAICAYSFRKGLAAKTMTYDDLVRLAVEVDVDGLDLTVYWFPSTSDDFLLPLRRLAYRNGVEIYSISIRTNMCQPSAELRDKEVEAVKRWVDVAGKLGAGHIRVFGGTVPENETEDRAAGWVADILERASQYSGGQGVILGLENHGGITSEAERIVNIVRQVNSPWVGINLDTGNFRTDAYNQIQMCLPYAVNAQFKTQIHDDSGERVPSDWDRIMKMFAEASYKGYVALEYEGKEDPVTAVPKMIRELNRLARKYSTKL